MKDGIRCSRLCYISVGCDILSQLLRVVRIEVEATCVRGQTASSGRAQSDGGGRFHEGLRLELNGRVVCVIIELLVEVDRKFLLVVFLVQLL